MRYSAIVRKQFRYIKVYNIRKSIKSEQNALSKYVSSLIDRYIIKRKSTGV